ncbi:MAG: hypothetical protein EOP07_18625, partial [Proteobacteria bacterium]
MRLYSLVLALALPLALLPTFARSESQSSPWSYTLAYDARAKVMDVEARLPAGVELEFDAEGEAFYSRMEKGESGEGLKLRAGMKVPSCKSKLCLVRYRFDLGKAASAKTSKDSLQAIR